jgi:Ran GTPase-activating protein (RanGAP) involved in mRNA processing and transport
LTDLNLVDNRIGDVGAESFAEVLGQRRAIAHLNLRDNYIRDVGSERFV